jgi:hypothetical protein
MNDKTGPGDYDIPSSIGEKVVEGNRKNPVRFSMGREPKFGSKVFD